MREYAEDDDKGSLLESLCVDFGGEERSQFALEALTPLRGIKNVSIFGSVSPWFATCLGMSIKGVGGEVHKSVYKERAVKTRHGRAENRTWKKVLESEKKWFMPEMDWTLFALVNGVEMPKDVQKFWENKEGREKIAPAPRDPRRAMYKEEGWMPDWDYQATHGHPLGY
jgi:hypothetical protein